MIVRADVCKLPFADQSVDLVFGSPPYCDARTYDDGTLPRGHVVSRGIDEWVKWMLVVTTECLRVSKGAVVWVAFGPTRDRDYWPACEGLMWEWRKLGGSMYRPCYWFKGREHENPATEELITVGNGIPGSGGNDWFRADIEHAMCFKRKGQLPWSDNTAMGKPARCKDVGGEFSNRNVDGRRINQAMGTGRSKRKKKPHTKANANGEMVMQHYAAPEISNPGNLIFAPVGGGHLGDSRAHENEAPFPEKLAEWFILSLCPPGGVVLDPFSGSGTTAKVAKQHGRRGIGSDIRTSQCLLTARRTKSVQRALL